MQNPTNFRQTAVHADGDGGILIQTRQDVSDIVEQNKKEYAESTNGKGWDGENAFSKKNKVASIPLVVLADLEKQGIMRGFHIIDMDRFKLWLNNPDNQVFRTRQGRI